MKMMAGRRALGRLEQLADAGGAQADELLHEAGGGHEVEGHPGLAGQGPGQQRLAAAGHAVEQDALGHVGAQALEAVGVAQVVDDLPQLGDGLVEAGHVGEGDRLHARLGVVAVDLLDLERRLATAAGGGDGSPAAAFLRRPENRPPGRVIRRVTIAVPMISN